MKKIKQLSFVLFIFFALVFSYPVTQVFAQGGGQCDNSLACNPTSGTCCNQCDPGPACNANDPNALPCCSLEGNDTSNVAPPQRGSASPEHDQMTHDRRADRLPPHKIGGELREKLNACHKELEMQAQQQPRRAQRTPAPNCSGSVQQATSANQALDVMCASIYQFLSSNTYLHLNNCNTYLWPGHGSGEQRANKVCIFTKDLRQQCIDRGRSE